MADFNDKTANGNNLTNSTTADSVNTPFAQSDTSIDFESTESDQAYAADSASLSITGSLTLEGWCNFESTPGTDTAMHLFGKWVDTVNDRSYQFRLLNSA